MKLRPIQLVCLALLLAALRLADPAALAPQEFALRAGVLQALLGNELQAESWIASPAAQVKHQPHPRTAHRQNLDLSSALVARVATVWAVAPPILQSAAVSTYSGLLRA